MKRKSCKSKRNSKKCSWRKKSIRAKGNCAKKSKRKSARKSKPKRKLKGGANEQNIDWLAGPIVNLEPP
jgi:hypothetical protein